MSSHLDYEINKELGECYLFMGDLEKAEEHYKKAAGSNGVHPDPYMGLATVCVQRGEAEAALGYYQKADSIAASDKTKAGIGLALMEMGDHATAFEAFAAALDVNPENAVALFGTLQLGHMLHRLDEVLPRLIACIEANPQNVEVRFSLAGCLAAMGHVDEAREQTEEVLKYDPDNAAAKELYATLANAA